MWPIIKKAVNSDLSTPLNIPINAIKEKTDLISDIKAKTDLITQIKSKTDLIMGKCQLFLANGTFVVPAGVYAVYLTGCAAGNSGRNGGSSQGGVGGAGGEIAFDFLVPNLTPGQSIAVTTGTGNTVFGSLTPVVTTYLMLTKGGGAAGGNPGVPGAAGESLMGMPYGGPGGAAGTGDTSAGGGGGGGAFGVGGAGGYMLSETEVVGQPGTGYGTGGGGGHKKTSKATGAGGAGAPGFLLVRWL